MLKQKYFLADIFILSAEKQPIKSSWRKIEWLHLNKRCGLVKNLEKELSVSNIHQLELLGYLEKEFSSEGEIWKLSEKGVKLRKLMMKHNSLGEIIKE